MATMHPMECLTNQTLKEADIIYISRTLIKEKKEKRNQKYLVTLKVWWIFMHDWSRVSKS